MSKPTSLAAQLKRDDEAEKMAQEKEDKEVSQKPAAAGKVWVRLVRDHYDSNNVLHLAGLAELRQDTQAQPPHRQLAQPAQRGRREGRTVVCLDPPR